LIGLVRRAVAFLKQAYADERLSRAPRSGSAARRSSHSSTSAFAPRIVATVNDYKIEVVKAEGEFVWHSHPDTDDFFLVLEGELEIELRDRTVQLRKGDLFVVHGGTPNTGDAAASELTAVERPI
jgi:mannose-6-phosphate isomerase-like protein (cupin superfamily)